MDTKQVIKGEKGSVRHITQQVELFKTMIPSRTNMWLIEVIAK